LQKSNTVTDYHTYSLEENIEVPNKVKLVEDNGYGGFSKKGSEYLIYN
jgi:hypothetical protein